MTVEIKKKSKFKEFCKKFGVYIGAIVLILALTITGLAVGLSGGVEDEKQVSGGVLSFTLPMKDASIDKGFDDVELQENITLDQWEAHLALDITSQDGIVYSVLDGKVIDVGYNYATGNEVVIQHDNGFVSIYSSLDKVLQVNKDDTVKAGQVIGSVGTSASDEELQGAHLHFVLKLNDKKVDPTMYIPFEKK